jgi:hypothetical protein
MLSLQAQDPLYLIVDAVDECPDRSGMSSAREQVLGIAELVGLRIPNLHLCVTSRPEVDIRTAFEVLTTLSVSFMSKVGKRKILLTTSILWFIRTPRCGDGERRIRGWLSRRSVKESMERKSVVFLSSVYLSILSNRFRWVYCQP